MPPWLHVGLAVLLTAYFLFRFIKDKYIYELLFVLWIPSTLLTYVSDDKLFLRCVGIAQVVLFILVIYFMFRKRGARRTKTLSILAQMAADSYQPDSPTTNSDNANTTQPTKPDSSTNNTIEETVDLKEK